MSSLTKIFKALVPQAAVKVRDICESHFKAGEFCCCLLFSWALFLTPARCYALNVNAFILFGKIASEELALKVREMRECSLHMD